jgi:hypothetical protein
MTRIRITGLALVAVFALSAVGAVTASAAEPELVNKSGAGHELLKKKFKDKGKAATLTTVAGRTVTCTANTSTGEVEGLKKDRKGSVKFTGCESSGLGAKSVAPAPVGKAKEIITRSLESELCFINAATDEVGLILRPEGGGLFTEIEVGANIEKLAVKGQVIGVVTPVDKLVTPKAEFTVTFTQAKGIQSPTKCEGEKEVALETEGEGFEKFAFEKSGEGATDTFLFEEAAEVIA